MTRIVETIYEKNVLKAINLIESIKEHERAALILCLLIRDCHFDHIHGFEVINWEGV